MRPSSFVASSSDYRRIHCSRIRKMAGMRVSDSFDHHCHHGLSHKGYSCLCRLPLSVVVSKSFALEAEAEQSLNQKPCVYAPPKCCFAMLYCT